MIDKILDKYYAKKLYEQIRLSLLVYYIDIKCEINNENLLVYAKPRTYKEELFIVIYHSKISNCFWELIDIKNVRASISNRIDFLEKHEWKM